MSLPQVVSREEWLTARKNLLAREKELTRQRDALNAERRRLPMVEIEEEYVFEGPDGQVSLLDLFDGRRQLIVYHFMFDPEWDEGCRSCSAWADHVARGHLQGLRSRETNLVMVSRAPMEKIAPFKARMGWQVPWYSSYGSAFNYDFHVTLDEAVAPIEYNYRTVAANGDPVPSRKSEEAPGISCFLHDGDRVFHTYSTYARGGESVGGAYYFLDLTALGRQEPWEEPKDRAAGGMGAGDPELPYPDESQADGISDPH